MQDAPEKPKQRERAEQSEKPLKEIDHEECQYLTALPGEKPMSNRLPGTVKATFQPDRRQAPAQNPVDSMLAAVCRCNKTTARIRTSKLPGMMDIGHFYYPAVRPLPVIILMIGRRGSSD